MKFPTAQHYCDICESIGMAFKLKYRDRVMSRRYLGEELKMEEMGTC